MYSVPQRLALLRRRLARENEDLLSLLREGYSLPRVEELLAARTEERRWGDAPHRREADI